MQSVGLPRPASPPGNAGSTGSRATQTEQTGVRAVSPPAHGSRQKTAKTARSQTLRKNAHTDRPGKGNVELDQLVMRWVNLSEHRRVNFRERYSLGRCLFKGFKNYAASVGCAIFCHNLVLLTGL